MSRTLVVARRELKSYFDSPVAYIVVVAFLLVAGWIYFGGGLFLSGQADMRPFFAPGFLAPSALLLILVPAVTMGLVAEERKSGTIELLTTMPIHDREIILGKFLGAMGLLASALGVTLVYAVSVSSIGELDWGPVISGYVGFLLYTGALVAIGLFCSTLAEDQIVAFIIAFVVSAALYFIYWLQMFMPGVAPFVEFFALGHRLENMARGVIDLRDVVYYLTVIGGALFLSVRGLERQHA